MSDPLPAPPPPPPPRRRRLAVAGAHVINGLSTIALLAPVPLIVLLGPERITECSIDGNGDITALGAPGNGQCSAPATLTLVAAGVLLLAGVVLGVLHLRRRRRRRRTLGAWVVRLPRAARLSPSGASG